MAHEPFDASDPFDAMADSIRRATTYAVSEHLSLALFKELGPARQLQAILVGSMTAILGVALIYVEKDGRDEIEQVIRDFVSAARANAEEMADAAIAVGDRHG